MDIDLSLLHSRTVEKIDITKEYFLPQKYYENNEEIIDISNLQVTGSVYLSSAEELSEDESDYIEATIKGTIILKDSISLEPVEYPILIEYDDIVEQNCKKNENTLDIFQFLWENIVLEVPLQFTKEEDLSKFHGDGWRLMSEDELTATKNPFNSLLKDFKEE